MAKRSALTKNPSATPVDRDVVYTGGSKDFDEVTGKYRSSGRATPAPIRLSPGVYRDSQGRLVGQGGRPLQQQPQRPPMQQLPQRPPMQQLPPQLGQQGKGPARDVYTPLPQPPMGLKPQQPDYTGGTGDYNRMPFTLGNEVDRELSLDMGLEDYKRRYGMGGGEYGVMPAIPSLPSNMGGGIGKDYTGNPADYNRLPSIPGYTGDGVRGGIGMGQQQSGLEQIARSRAEAIARGDRVTTDFNPEREALVNRYLQEMGQRPPGGMGGPVNYPAGNMGGMNGGRGMVKQPLDNMGGRMKPTLPFSPGMVDPRTMVGPQYDPSSIAFPVNNYSDRGNNSMRDSIARRALMLRDQNALSNKQNLGNYNMQDMVPYNANRRR